MSKEQTLAKIEHDLNLGHTYPALQRLASLAVAYPDDLDIRARRAAVSRQIGNFREAGRWGYLTEDVQPQDIAAFERAFPRPWAQLLALKLQRDPSPHLARAAKTRLHRLTLAAAEDGPAPVAWTEVGPRPMHGSTWASTLGAVGCALIVVLGVLTLFGLAVYGYLKLFNII